MLTDLYSWFIGWAAAHPNFVLWFKNIPQHKLTLLYSAGYLTASVMIVYAVFIIYNNRMLALQYALNLAESGNRKKASGTALDRALRIPEDNLSGSKGTINLKQIKRDISWAHMTSWEGELVGRPDVPLFIDTSALPDPSNQPITDVAEFDKVTLKSGAHVGGIDCKVLVAKKGTAFLKGQITCQTLDAGEGFVDFEELVTCDTMIRGPKVTFQKGFVLEGVHYIAVNSDGTPTEVENENPPKTPPTTKTPPPFSPTIPPREATLNQPEAATGDFNLPRQPEANSGTSPNKANFLGRKWKDRSKKDKAIFLALSFAIVLFLFGAGVQYFESSETYRSALQAISEQMATTEQTPNTGETSSINSARESMLSGRETYMRVTEDIKAVAENMQPLPAEKRQQLQKLEGRLCGAAHVYGESIEYYIKTIDSAITKVQSEITTTRGDTRLTHLQKQNLAADQQVAIQALKTAKQSGLTELATLNKQYPTYKTCWDTNKHNH